MDGLVISREEELRALGSFLGPTPPGASVLVLEGEAGIGKSTLWQAAVAAAREQGARVLRSQPAQSEATLSFAGLGDLFEPVLPEVAQELPGPQRQALEVALLQETDDSGPQQRAVAAGVRSALRALARSGPAVLVAVDDVQWLDRPSAGALAFALRRLGDEPVRFLVAERQEHGRPAALGLDREPPGVALSRLRIGPLALAALQRLLHARLGVTFPRPMLRRIHQTSGGNPFFALQLAHAIGELTEPLHPGDPLPLPDDVRALVRERLTGLPDETSEALLAAAVLTDPTLSRLEGAVGTDAGEALRPAVEADIVRVEGERVCFEHPLFASGVVESVPPGRRRALHGRLAAAASEPEVRARHLALGADGPDGAVAAELERTAPTVAARGAPEAAAELAEQAVRLTPPDHREAAHARALAATTFHWIAGDARRARALIGSVLEDCPAGAIRAQALTRLARVQTLTGDRRQALETFHDALREARGDPALRAQAHEGFAWCLHLMRLDTRRALAHARAAVKIADAVGHRAFLGDALSAQAQAEFVLGGGLPNAAIERALALAAPSDEERRVLLQPAMHHSLMLQCADQLEAARDLLRRMRDLATVHGDESSLAYVLMRLAHAEVVAGNWTVAAQRCEEGLVAALQNEQSPLRAGLLCVRALIAAHQGRTDDARRDATAGLELAEAASDGVARRLGQWAIGLTESSLGDAEATVATLLPLWESSGRAGVLDPGENRYLADLIEALAALGRLEEAEALAVELARRGERLGRPSAQGVAERGHGLVAAARGEREAALAALERAREHHERATLPFERGRTLLVLGEEQQRARRRRDARESLERAAAVFDGLGARPWEERARSRIGSISGRAPARNGLTPAERRVAGLVVQGHTNREVAAALFVTDRTVETHLSRIYRKLGVRSRTELARLYGGGR